MNGSRTVAVYVLLAFLALLSGRSSASSHLLMADNASDFSALCQRALDDAQGQFRQLEGFSGEATQESFLTPLNNLMWLLADTAKQAGLYESVHPDEPLRKSAETCSQNVDKLSAKLGLSKSIYRQLEKYSVAGLSRSDRYYIETLRRDFILSGVALEEKQRHQVLLLQEEIVKLGQDFSRTIREDVRSITLDSVEQLQGLPKDYIAQHQPDAQGEISVSTRYPDYIPFMTYADDDELRKKLFITARSRGYPDNKENLKKLIQKRQELARLLGFKTHADLATVDKMIGSADNAAEFIDKVVETSRPAMHKDREALLERLQQDTPSADQVQRWQLSYLKDKIKAEEFHVDTKSLRPYFAYERVKLGVFDLVERLFQVQFKPWDSPVWHESVEAWEMWDGDSLLGRFYLDMHPREGKYQHAAMFPTLTGLHEKQIPVATLVCNFPGENDGLEKMEFAQVETLLHEFGHLLHELFSGRNRWVAQSGIATEWDFVEAPSQMLEEWIYDSRVLKALAVNDQGEALSDEVIERLKRAREFNKGMAAHIQMYYAAISLNVYRQDLHDIDRLDLDVMMSDLAEQYSPTPFVPETHFYANFGHLNGYSAIYYTYMWSQVIALDMFSRFEEEGLLNVETARHYRKTVLEQGGKKPASELVRDFLGRDFNFNRFSKKMNH